MEQQLIKNLSDVYVALNNIEVKGEQNIQNMFASIKIVQQTINDLKNSIPKGVIDNDGNTE